MTPKENNDYVTQDPHTGQNLNQNQLHTNKNMKTITFYNEKGGVGKSAMNTLFANWLHYKNGIKTAMIDFDGKTAVNRRCELRYLTGKGIECPEKYPIINARKKSDKGTEDKYTNIIKNILKSEISPDTQVLVIDLPGTIDEDLATAFLSGTFGLIIIPVTRDEQTIRAALNTMKLIKTMKQDCYCFLNEIQTYYSKSKYEDMADTLMQLNMTVLPDMISFTERFKNNTTQSKLRSTLFYPDWESKEYSGSKDLGTENLFISAAQLLLNTPDLSGTSPANIETLRGLEKKTDKQSLARQLVNNSCPELALLKTQSTEEFK